MSENRTKQLDKHDVAEWLNLSPQTVAKMAKAGRLPGRLVAGRWRFDPREVEAWLRTQPRSDSE